MLNIPFTKTSLGWIKEDPDVEIWKNPTIFSGRDTIGTTTMTSTATARAAGTDLAMRYLKGEKFNALYRDVMAFVQKTAEYLDGEGRAESKKLNREAANAYVVLTRQLTTAAMRLANISLTLRAAKNGDMPFAKAMSDIRDKDLTHSVECYPVELDGVPQGLLDLVALCEDLRTEATRIVESLGTEGRSGPNPVHASLDLIGQAFGGR